MFGQVSNIQLIPTPLLAYERGAAAKAKIQPQQEIGIADENDVPIEDENLTNLINETQ